MFYRQMEYYKINILLKQRIQVLPHLDHFILLYMCAWLSFSHYLM